MDTQESFGVRWAKRLGTATAMVMAIGLLGFIVILIIAGLLRFGNWAL